MYLNGGKNGNSASRKAENTIFTAVQTANRRYVFQEEEDGSASTVRNVGKILSKKVNKILKQVFSQTGWKTAGLFAFYTDFSVHGDPDLLKFYKTYTIPCFQLL